MVHYDTDVLHSSSATVIAGFHETVGYSWVRLQVTTFIAGLPREWQITSEEFNGNWIFSSSYLPSVLWCCWLSGRNSIIWPVIKRSGVVLAWLSVSSKVPLPLTISYFSNTRLVLPEWFCFTGATLPRLSWKKSVLNKCTSSNSSSGEYLVAT